MFKNYYRPSCWDRRIHWLHLCKNVKSLNECPIYDTKPMDGGTPVQEFCGIWSTSSLPLLPGSLGSVVVVLDRVTYLGKIQLFDHLIIDKQMINGLVCFFV